MMVREAFLQRLIEEILQILTGVEGRLEACFQ